MIDYQMLVSDFLLGNHNQVLEVIEISDAIQKSLIKYINLNTNDVKLIKIIHDPMNSGEIIKKIKQKKDYDYSTCLDKLKKLNIIKHHDSVLLSLTAIGTRIAQML
jgi:hypothetical protein